jgi:flagellum-specific peptidoglycan hydrolase FlgJ
VNTLQLAFLQSATTEARKADHPFPEMAACEAALESSYGNSELARAGNNLFGTKQHAHPIYGTMSLPTKEFLDGQWLACTSQWVEYPDVASCFADRLATLERLANAYPHYKAALEAEDAETFVTQVSLTWSTDPERAAKVISIYREYVQPPNESR